MIVLQKYFASHLVLHGIFYELIIEHFGSNNDFAILRVFATLSGNNVIESFR